MKIDCNHLNHYLNDIATSIAKRDEPESHHYDFFMEKPQLALGLVDLFAALSDTYNKEQQNYYSACVFALDVCVAQLQSRSENGNKSATKTLEQLMTLIAQAMHYGKHTLGFWLPILSAFYEVQVELSEELKDAYLALAGQDTESQGSEVNDLEAIREMVIELADLSVFDIAETFFAQSHAMPADFFADLLVDLYSIPESQDIALLTLIHPKQEVREVILAMFEQLLPSLTLTPISLTRLQAIQYWYPENYTKQFEHWIKVQRKKGVTFYQKSQQDVQISFKASEVDGGGAQGLFIEFKRGKKYRFCGILFKLDLGIRDVWLTPEISGSEVDKYYQEALHEMINLRIVDLPYVVLVTNHFLGRMVKRGEIPDLHLLEIQELLELRFKPEEIEIQPLMEQMSSQIIPFTGSTLSASLKRSRNWLNSKQFTQSWFIENAHIDKLVNRCSSFSKGVRLCNLKEAAEVVFTHELEVDRDRWLFHFLWVALWLKAKTRKNVKMWQDSFLIAYAIYNGMALRNIPLMQEICNETVLHSIDTMRERRTHLASE